MPALIKRNGRIHRRICHRHGILLLKPGADHKHTQERGRFRWEYVRVVGTFVSNTLTFATGGINLWQNSNGLYQKYKAGEQISIEDVATVALNAATCVAAGTGMVKEAKNLGKMMKEDNVVGQLKESVGRFGSGSKQSLRSESGTELRISDRSKEICCQGTFDSVEASLDYHFTEYRKEVGAVDIDQYVRKVESFSQNLRGARKSYPTEGTLGAIRYTKSGKYIIIGPDKKILSFGLER